MSAVYINVMRRQYQPSQVGNCLVANVNVRRFGQAGKQNMVERKINNEKLDICAVNEMKM